ncbi:16S rRNA m(7)G-527 methyltransferase [Hydrogenivirga caldilitoris]|uniref:Ribosomal RNA small subunit methyltransferase G n=1 Tax=Hydrogenivirga caldilitoris TaxID=246264 RepID=A0A497XWU2_9AQUI|nr:16S rRNA (guanine(527)-N(7))-methyltransferase RsmG [Hydrogenivirga caldilitoris]RLJ71233.1 16S rRNA m(7)G-527 methyltransferase [Hydrogenivirga caldilitoris]
MSELIGSIFSEAGFKLSPEDVEKFGVYLVELKKWNRVHNLTSLKRDEDIIRKHFLDSLSLVNCFREVNVDWKGKSIADVGSGAGFPGVPLKIYLKDVNLFLIESVSKKCSFLEYLKVRLELDWTVLCQRAEEVDTKFDIVVSRAMGEFEEVYRILERLARDYVFVMKGKELKSEWIQELKYNACKAEIKGLPPSYILWKKLN